MDLINSIIYNISIDNIATLLKFYPIAYGLSSALFCCITLIVNSFVSYRVFTARLLIAWILSCGIVLVCLAQYKNIEEVETLNLMLNTQAILSFISCNIILILYVLNLAFQKPLKRKKNYGKHNWWIRIIGFIVLLAFCCIFNIAFYVSVFEVILYIR